MEDHRDVSKGTPQELARAALLLHVDSTPLPQGVALQSLPCGVDGSIVAVSVLRRSQLSWLYGFSMGP